MDRLFSRDLREDGANQQPPTSESGGPVRVAQDCVLTVGIVAHEWLDGLGETLASVAGIADEILILSTQPTDALRDQAHQAGAKVLACEWDSDLSALGNHGLNQARGKWFLWLNAGETMASGCLAIRDEMLADPDRAWTLFVRSPAAHGDVSPEQVAQTRLIPVRSTVAFEQCAQPAPDASLAKAGVRVEPSALCIDRPPTWNAPPAKVRRARRDLELAGIDIKRSGATAAKLNCLGEAWQSLDNNLEAHRFYEQALAASERGSHEMLTAFYGMLTTFDDDRESREAQLAMCLEALEVFPLDVQLLCALGGYLQTQQRMDLARRAWQTAWEHGTVDIRVTHLEEVHEVAAVCYALALQLESNHDQAREVLEKTAAQSPGSRRVHRHLIELEVKLQRRTEALEWVDRTRELWPRAEALRSAIRGACLAVAGNWPVARAYLETAFNQGCVEPVCLRWLTVALLGLGESERAREVLQQWRQQEPGNSEVYRLWASQSNLGSADVRIDEASQQPASRQHHVSRPASDLRVS